MASRQLETIIQVIRSQPKREGESIQERRAGYEMMATMFPVAADVKREPAEANGVHGEWISAPNATDAATILYLHGGGYTEGSINTHADLVSRISRSSGARAFSLEYRLAPEHPFQAAIDDAMIAYRWLLKQGTPADSIVIAGDSAGGGLTLATLLALKDTGDPLPGAAVLLSPWTDLEGTGDSMTSRAERDPMVAADQIEGMAQIYARAVSFRHPRI